MNPGLLPVADAFARITGAFAPLPAEDVALTEALGRVLAEDVTARRTQPPVAVSSMDGYAVRAEDVAQPGAVLRLVGESAAGHGFAGRLCAGEAVRIFTGAPLPEGADAVVMQEDTDAAGETVTIRVSAAPGRFVRPAGLDFREGEVGLRAGRRLGPREIGLAAAMNRPWLSVRRRPRVALIATGDEVVRPGDPMGPFQIVSSNTPALAALVREAGGEALDLGIAADNAESLRRIVAGAAGADLLVTTGGASVGDHDLIRAVLGEEGLELDFWRIAMRPGKPLIFGHVRGTPLLGVPGNPVSALVCAILFLRPAIETMLGIENPGPVRARARLGEDLPANDGREEYMRARLAPGDDGEPIATPLPRQDSSMLSALVRADCLLVRPPHAPAARKGETVTILPL